MKWIFQLQQKLKQLKSGLLIWLDMRCCNITSQSEPLSQGSSVLATPTFPLIFCIFKFNFYWSIVDLQWCVCFGCTAKCISYTYTCIHSFLDSIHYRVLSRVPCAGPYQLSILYIAVCVYVNSNLLIYPSPFYSFIQQIFMTFLFLLKKENLYLWKNFENLN